MTTTAQSDSPHFAFLQPEWPDLHEAAIRAEALAYPDPRAACFYARRTLELAVAWLYQRDQTLRLPYQDNLNALIHEPTFKQAAGPAVFTKAKLIKDLGNQAAHSPKPVRQPDALTAVRELFHLCFWLARTYARGAPPPDGLSFNPDALPKSSPVPPQTQAQLQALAAQLAERDANLSALRSDRAALDEELQRLRADVTRAKAANAARPDTHDYSEATTRDAFIDLLLREAGWPLDQPRDREVQVIGMPTETGTGFVDYVLWGEDGRPLGLVEAKRTHRDARAGQQQARLYADCLERQYGQRPVIFYSNGYEHWLWDDAAYPPRPVQGFLTKDELALLLQRRTTRLPLATAAIDPAIVERYYQTRAIRRITEAFEQDRERKALVVMATSAGKTRTVIALCDLLMRCNWVKRVLFLADRKALVRQAVNAFKAHLPGSSPVNLVTERDAEGRVYVSTYPTMMGLIEEQPNGRRRFGVGHFDLIVIDEAHRSVYQKHRAIFEYFDSLLVGLTATPKDEIDRNTYGLFDLETGVPTDAYSLDDAVADGFLVPPRAVSVPLKFEREGIRYDSLSEAEKEEWDALDWSDDDPPDAVDPASVNRWLFNADTVDKVLAHLMERGQKVAGGDRLGKTIIFAKNHAHAAFIAERFDWYFPEYKGEFARVIDVQVDYADSLIENFAQPDKPPHIAISVDMLDTGIDIPEAVNLVLFKLVRSKTKFWQMLGRGTRLCPDLFGPGQHKEFFYVFDFCQNLEYFSQNPQTTAGAVGDSLSARLFKKRLDVLGELDRRLKPATGPVRQVQEASAPYGDPATDADVRRDLAAQLQGYVAAMNVENFLVRPHRQLVETYARPEAWAVLEEGDRDTRARSVAGLPSARGDEGEEAKRFDLLLLRLQLAVLRAERSFERLRDQVRAIAEALEDKSSIPMVREQLALIQEVQSDAFWQDVTAPMLETVRRRLRGLVRLIEKAKRQPVYTDFEDQIGAETGIDLPGFSAGADLARFRAKTRQFLHAHGDNLTVHKLRWNKPLASTDLDELERLLLAEGVATLEDLGRAKEACSGLGLFIRSLLGLNRAAAHEAFNDFLARKTPTANQIEFIKMIVDHLVDHGVMDPSLLYESPFTDIHPQGPEGVFTSPEVDRLIGVLDDIRQRAIA